MSSQQKTQEKKAWHTPEIVVLTRGTASESQILRVCKTATCGNGPITMEATCMKRSSHMPYDCMHCKHEQVG